MQTNSRKTDDRQAAEQLSGIAEKKRLSVLRQCNVAGGMYRSKMTGSKINETIGDMIASGELKLLSTGKGGRLCETTDLGKQSLEEGFTVFCDTVFTRNEDNTNSSRNDPTQFEGMSKKVENIGKAKFVEYTTISEKSVLDLIASLKRKAKKDKATE